MKLPVQQSKSNRIKSVCRKKKTAWKIQLFLGYSYVSPFLTLSPTITLSLSLSVSLTVSLSIHLLSGDSVGRTLAKSVKSAEKTRTGSARTFVRWEKVLWCGVCETLWSIGFLIPLDSLTPSFSHSRGRRMEAVAKHDFTATAEDELSFRRSQVLKVLLQNLFPTLLKTWTFDSQLATLNLNRCPQSNREACFFFRVRRPGQVPNFLSLLWNSSAWLVFLGNYILGHLFVGVLKKGIFQFWL